MAELEGTMSSGRIFKEWWDRYGKRPGAYAPPVIETPTTFPIDPSLSMPASSTPTPGAPVAAPGAAPQMDVAPPAEQATSLTDRFNSGLSRVGEGLKDPTKMGLLAAGLSMMATPPRQVPYSNTEILGNAGLTGIKYYETALEAKRKDELMKQTAEEHKLTREDQSFYRKGMLEDRAAQRTIQKQTADSLEAQRKAAETLTGSLNAPVSDAYLASIGRQDLVGQGITYGQLRAAASPMNADLRSQGQLVQVKQADGTVVYERRSDAAGQEVAPKPTQKYKNVPGVGMVDISGPEPVVKIKSPVFGGKGGAGGRPTANIQNIEYLVGNGWNRKEAEDMILQGKRMPRETFIANMTKSIYGNEFIDDADKASKMQEAIKFYDSTIPQRGGEKKAAATGKALDQATATSILQEAGGDKDKARKIAKERGYTF